MTLLETSLLNLAITKMSFLTQSKSDEFLLQLIARLARIQPVHHNNVCLVHVFFSNNIGLTEPVWCMELTYKIQDRIAAGL